MSLNLVTLLYLVASVCFIQALKGLSHPTTSIRGNLFGMCGMAIAVLTTAALIVKLINAQPAGTAAGGLPYVLAALVVGGAIGSLMAKRVEMTKMPELVAFMHSMIGLAAVFIAIACVAEPWAFNIVAKGEPIPTGNKLELFIGCFVGAITFSGSVIAFAVVTESIFAWPGMGKLLIYSINQLDRPVIVAYVLLIVLMFVLINLVVDVLYSLLDPRIRLADTGGAR